MASFGAAVVGDILVTIEEKTDGIYTRRYNINNGQQILFSDGNAEKKVITTAVPFAQVPVDQGLIAIVLESDRSLWLSYDAGATFTKVTT